MEKQILIALLGFLVNVGIAYWNIRTNRKIAKENAGKNKVIYGIEEKTVSPGDPRTLKPINEALNTGNYTILSVFQNRSNTSEHIYSLGKINP